MNVSGLLHDALTQSTRVSGGGDTFMVVTTSKINEGGGGIKNPGQGSGSSIADDSAPRKPKPKSVKKPKR